MSGRITVSLSALADNYKRLARHAQGEVAAVVKANGYGLGAAAIASRLHREGCHELFVATAAEGVLLRQALPDPTIYVLEGVYDETLQDLVDTQLTPVLNTRAQCSTWAEVTSPAAVHIDSGMQRLGLADLDDIADLHQLPFPISLLISHFARADEPGHNTIAAQIDRTQSVYRDLRKTHTNMRLSLCNSAGLLQGLGPEDVGRAGIGLYGGNPYNHQINPMQAIVKLEARVMQIRSVAQGVPVGYGGTFTTQRASQLAILGVGYADGVPRLLSGKGRVHLGGQSCPIVGRVSMDLLIVDATDVNIQEGDWAQVMGPEVPLDEIADLAQTLSYEILTHISARVPRSYLAGSL